MCASCSEAAGRYTVMQRLLVLLMLLCASAAQAANYTFPTAMPAGCSGSAGVYSCGSLTLVDGDTVVISGTKPATITITGNFSTGNTDINTGGSASDLTVNVSGTLTMGHQVAIKANISAGTVVDPNGYGQLTGNLSTTSGALTLGYQFNVDGDLSSTSGTITTGQSGTVTGNITSGSGSITIGYAGNVSGRVQSGGAITLSQDAVVYGSVLGGSGAVGVGYAARVYGEVSSSSGSISVGQNADAQACVSSSSGTITLNPSSTTWRVCCGAGVCGSACVTNNSGSSMPSACPTPVQRAQWLLDETSWPHSSNDVLDSSGNARHGSSQYNAAAGGCAAPWGTFAGSTGAPDRVQVPYNAALSPAGSFSTMAWVRATGGAGTSRVALSNRVRGAASPYRGWMLLANTNDTWEFWLAYGGSTSDTQGSFGSATLNSWSHLAATFLSQSGPDGSGGYTGLLKLYRDGVLVYNKHNARYVPNNAQPIYIGSGGFTAGAGGDSLGHSLYPFQGHIDDVKVYASNLRASEVAAAMSRTTACPGPHHLELRHGSGSGLTCTPSTLTVAACNDAGCTSYYSGAVSGSLTASGSGQTVNWPAGAAFSVAAGAGTSTVSLQQTTVGSVTLGSTGVSPAAGNATTCNFGSPSCTHSAADAGFLFDVPHHVAETANTVAISAVKKADNSLACAPAFASTSKAVTFACSYNNPTTGTRPVRVGGAALNAGNNTAAACDGGGRAVNLAFDASGAASTTVQYADVGRLTLAASYTGTGSEAGLAMSGSDGFIAAPASFAFSAVTAAPMAAGAPFGATVTALNSAGGPAPNFGRETTPEGVALGFNRRSPTGVGAVDGSFSGSVGAFSNGAASASNLRWTEVGTIDLSATLASGSYLGSGLAASGSTGSGGAVGRFTPHHFDVVVTPACAAGGFSYAGQPFTTTVTARNAAGDVTVNYNGTASTSPAYAKALTLADAAGLGLGSLSGNSIAAAGFSAGVGSASPAYSFTSKPTAPQTLTLRASDADGISSAGWAEGSTPLRSGRLRLSNTFGKAASALQVPVLAEHWGGSSWVLNSADSCTTLAAANVALSNGRNGLGSASAATSSASAVSLSGGQGTLTLAAPSPAGSTVSFDLALNLGSTAADLSCHANHPATTGAAKPWLRSLNGSCAATWNRDPAARVSFGIYSPESRKKVHLREIF